MNDTFLNVSMSSITVQNLGKIVQRAPAVGAKMWYLHSQADPSARHH